MRSSRSNSRAVLANNKSQSSTTRRDASSAKKSPAARQQQVVEMKKSIRNKSRGSNAATPQSNGKSKASQSQNNNDESLYSKGTYVAFIDPSDSLEKFKIALLLEDLREVDEEVEVQVFSEASNLTYNLSAAKVPIFEYAIVCDLVVIEDKPAAPARRGAKQAQVKVVKITKQQFNKVHKHMENTVRRIEEEQKDKDEEEDESSEEEEEQEESSVAAPEVMKKDTKATIESRRMVKAAPKGGKKESTPVRGRNSSVVAIKATASAPSINVKDVKAAASKALPSKGGRKSSKAPVAKESEEESKGDLEMTEKEEEDVSVEMIDTSKKRPSKAGTKKRAESIPKVGSKRLRKNPKKNLDEDGEDDQSNAEEDEEGNSQPSKKRKIGAGKAKVEKQPKAKKAVKKPTEFKKGKWNPTVELVTLDKYKDHKQEEIFIECCIRCNNRNVVRACNTNNEALLQKCLAAKDKISLLTAYWSPDLKITALQLVLCNNSHNLLEILLHPKVTIPQHSTYEAERNTFYNTRVNNPQYLMQFIDSGMVGNMAYGTRVRKVEMTRGNRQGNNAFLQYTDNYQKNPVYQLTDDSFMEMIFHSNTLDHETLKQAFKLNPQIEVHLQSYVYEAVRAGNRKVAYEIIKQTVQHPNFGFNQLHADVLSDDAVLEKVLKQSVTKKANTNKDLTPLHCACINPNPKYLRALLETGAEMQTIDQDLRRPVHYAAACEGPEPLKVLIEQGANLTDQDNQKRNCLHIAAIAGRAENIRTILTTNPGLVNTRDKKSMTPIAYACKYSRLEALKVLLQFKAKLNVGCGQQRMTPLCWASTYGSYDLVEYLLSLKARVLGKDKFQRTPLILAVRNGHTQIASLLLQNGSEWDHHDSSMNTPLHYAAAYGWLDCIELLLKAGADVNSQNSWKVSPINIAMLKNHHGCVKRFLEEPNVDVNGKDDKGRTLIMLSLMILDEESEEFVSYLLKKGADPNIADLDGYASLHYIARYQPRSTDEHGKISKFIYKRQVETQKKIAQLLIQNGADLSLKNKDEQTAFSICLEKDNAPLLEFLKDKVSLNKEPELLFAFKDKIFNVEYQRILEQLIQNDHPTKETMNCLDANGLTPFLAFVNAFTTNHDALLVTISNKINQQSFIHGTNKRMYQLTNADIFDKFADQANFYNYNHQFSQEDKMSLSREFFDSIIAKPFINMMRTLIKKGCDIHAQVQKLKKYRDLEELKRVQLIQLAAGEQVPVVDSKKEKEEMEVKRREEKMKEMQDRKRNQYGGGRGKGGRGLYRNQKAAYNPYGNNDVAAENDKETFDKINGEKVLREYGPNGQRNAIHFILAQPQRSVFEFLVSIGVDADQPDYDEVTPFNLLSTKNINPADPKDDGEVFHKLLKLDVRVDFPNRKGRTAFLNFYEKQNFDYSQKMLDLGANVNQMDTSGLFALKYALIRRHNAGIQKLLDCGANINQIDNKGRNLLHHAINMSSATADATFETEQFLIERGVDINLRDNKSRTPLHYSFVKIQDWKNSQQIDPIETVSSMCGCKGLELDVPDKWQKTPLHYASQRGASICAMYLIQRGASMDSKDIYGNSPLGVGLMYQHYNYGIILIQKQASVHPLTFREEPDRIKKQWEEEEKAKLAQYKISQKKQRGLGTAEDEEMADGEEKPKFAKHVPKKHQAMFQGGQHNIDYDDEDDYDNEDDEESEDEDDMHQENIFNQQNAFGQPVYAQKKTPATFGYQGAFGGFGGGMQTRAAAQSAPAVGGNLISDKDKEGVSMFKLSIRGGQQGLAYLMIDNGYDLMLAMQDAMDEKKFMLVLTLLSKTPDDHVIQSKNSKGQNLFHILSMNASGCALENLQRIYEALKKRGVDMKCKDNFGRTALHYAVISNSTTLVKMLLTQEEGYDANEIDNEGQSPLSLYLKGETNCAHPFYNAAFKLENIFYFLAKAGADVNVVYPEGQYKPDLKDEELEEEHLGVYDQKAQYFSTPLINLLRINPVNETLRHNLIGLIEFGAKLNVVDSDGRDPVMYAIMKNNIMALKMLFENKKELHLNPKGQDKAGKTAAHYAVNPVRFGSFENTEILQLLHKYGFSLQIKDAQGKTPAHYAAEQESGVMLNEIAKLVGMQDQLSMINRQLSMIATNNWPESKVDYEIDAEQYMELANEREAQLAKEQDKRVPVDKTGRFEISYQVYYDDAQKPWDVYLTKVDLKNGIYGDYVFYKMQLLYDTNRDLYVVFTRWGRIGETGMNQRTPFIKVDDAKDDFRKIFKQKTGGNVFDDLEQFSRIKKKYNLTRVNYQTVDMKDYLQPFDYEKCPKSRLRQETYDLFQEISNVTMYQRAFAQHGVDTSVLPFSGVKKQSLVEARQLLLDIQECIKEDIEISKEGIKADFDKLTAVKEKISELSGLYYELIPSERFKNQIAPPINNMHQVKTQYDLLDTLSNIEYASKVLLGALLKQKEMNPIDYVYHAMNLQIDPLETQGAEYEVIRKYIDNTRTPDQQRDMFEIANIFKVQRKGEAELIQNYKEVPNHFLLFHGSMMFNFIGILSQGLKIAPPEAPTTGYMFGKGVYFADMFDKSFAYAARGYGQQDSYLMLMCEVVLGKSKEINQAEYIEKLEHPFHSVKGCGRRGPGYKHTITLPNGVKIPYGPVINYLENEPERQKSLQLQHNEYIVYNTSQIRMRYVVQVKKRDPTKANK